VTGEPALAPARIADLLEASTDIVTAELAALADAAGWRPEAGEWSANECVGHLIEAERRGFAGRIRHILSTSGPDEVVELKGWDPPTVAAARHDDQRPGSELAAEFAQLRADSVLLVRGLDRADLPRIGRHPDVGPLQVGEVMAEWVHHDRRHLRQILAISQARVWGQMGNARRFSLEDL
jgi:DinB superfamily